ncbi:hypothetical protein JOD54_002460 [Actinokineospora baliensis]|uniref:FtsX-like permease family protein n=1 Tax=Actinokineospora baliensis TaxID=547056 RepID=UPI001956D310|nr:FtsX-like permease family protein [Actinokineospora baliensis]MBM7772256.1 hypothetical protein [Actinokineospora baliensis]
MADGATRSGRAARLRAASGFGVVRWRFRGVRFALVVIDIGLCVTVLLFAAGAVEAMGRAAAREAARTPVFGGQSSLMVGGGGFGYGGISVSGREVQGVGPLPPGVRRLPADGEVVVSPALAALLDSDPQLRERLPGVRVGLISPAGLVGADELYFYRGTSGLTAASAVSGFGTGRASAASPGQLFGVGLGVVAVLAPLLVFVSCLARLGVAERDRRLATLRLLGASTGQVRVVAAAESFVGALAGLAVGILFFSLGSAHVADFGLGSVSWGVVVAVGLVVLALAVGAVLVGIKSVLVEPLGVVRGGGLARRRLGWRLAPVALGLGLLLPVVLDAVADLAVVSTLVVAGVLSLLLAIPVLLPLLVERAAGVVRGGPPSWQLAMRRLQLDSGTPSRVVGGLAVVLAGAIGAHALTRSVGLPGVTGPWVFDGAVALLAGFTLFVAGASLLVLAVHQLGERRRALAALAAAGTPWSVIGRSLLWQNLVPVVFGVLIADAAGLWLSAVALRVLATPVRVDWAFIGLLNIAAVLTVCVATITAIPVLRVTARADGLRVE